MTPYYEQDGITIWHGDCREILPMLQQPDVCITDPVWPNSVFPNVTDPAQLFAEAAVLLTGSRLVVHLGCSSDPRFLAGVPSRYPFVRVAWLVGIYGESSVIDPFMGTGTTLEAAKRAGLPCVGIDSEEANCEIAANRLMQSMLPMEFSA